MKELQVAELWRVFDDFCEFHQIVGENVTSIVTKSTP